MGKRVEKGFMLSSFECGYFCYLWVIYYLIVLDLSFLDRDWEDWIFCYWEEEKEKILLIFEVELNIILEIFLEVDVVVEILLLLCELYLDFLRVRRGFFGWFINRLYEGKDFWVFICYNGINIDFYFFKSGYIIYL